MQKIFYLLTILSMFVISACEEAYDISGIDIKELNFKDYKEAKSIIGDYADFLIFHNSGMVTTSDYSFYEDPNNKLSAIRANKCRNSAFAGVREASGVRQINRGTYYLNDIEFKYDDTKQAYPYKLDFFCDTDNIYGRYNNIKFIGKDGNIAFSKDYYFPLQFNKFENGLKEMDYNNYVFVKDRIPIFWNKDVNNKNGVVFELQWNGFIAEKPIEEKGNYERIRRALWIKEDLGEVTLPKDFLRGIPQNGVFTIKLHRGAGENVPIILSDGSTEYFNFHNSVTTQWIYRKK